MKSARAAATIVSIALAWWAAPALACTYVPPPPQFQLHALEVPSNIGGALLRDCQELIDGARWPEVSLRAQDSDEELALRVEHLRQDLFEVIFEEALEEETTYIVESSSCENQEPDIWRWSFATTRPAEEPEDLGVWLPSDRQYGEVIIPVDDSCDARVDAVYIEFDFEPGPGAELWGRALAFETYVDGRIWEPRESIPVPLPPGTGRLGYGKERVYVVCDELIQPEAHPLARALDEGIHRVQIRAFLPGTDLVWTSESHSFVLRCERDGEPGDDDGEEEKEDIFPESEEESEPDEAGGCAQVPGSPGFLWTFIAGGLLFSRRRRR